MISISMMASYALYASLYNNTLIEGYVDRVAFKEACRKGAEGCAAVAVLPKELRQIWVKNGDGVKAKDRVQWRLCKDEEGTFCLYISDKDRDEINKALIESRAKFVVLLVNDTAVSTFTIIGPMGETLEIGQMDGSNPPSELLSFLSSSGVR